MMRNLLAALVLTAGCTTLDAAGEAPAAPDPGACDAAAGTSLVGTAATAALGANALRLTGARGLRWIRPGDAVTMDYRPDRLNVKLDAAGKVESFNCG